MATPVLSDDSDKTAVLKNDDNLTEILSRRVGNPNPAGETAVQQSPTDLNVTLSERTLGSKGSRKHSKHVDDPGHKSKSQAVMMALPEWWAKRAAAAGLSGRWLDLDLALSAERPKYTVNTHTTKNLLNGLAPEALGDFYVNSLEAAVRAKHGRHYTPLTLAELLWKQTRRALGWKDTQTALPGRVHDPAVGGGVLLLPPLREHLLATRHKDPSEILDLLPELLSGSDLDADAAYLASVVLASELLPLLANINEEKRAPLPALCTVADGLRKLERKAQVVIMNPPYGRVKLSDEERLRFSDAVYGHANLYSLFMAAASENLLNGGVLSALVPTSFTAGMYFKNLRKKLSKESPLAEIAFVVDRSGTFSTGVLQETCLATFSSTGKQVGVAVGCVTEDGLESFPTVPFLGGEGPWLLPRRIEDHPLVVCASKMQSTISAQGWKISTGPLVWNRKKPQIHAAPKGESIRIIWGSDIEGGTLRQAAARDKQRYFEILTPSDKSVLTFSKEAVLLQRTTAPEQARRLVSALLDDSALAKWGGKVAVENHVNIATCKEECALTPALMARVLATDTMDRVLRSVTGSVAVSAYELESLPIPNEDVVAAWKDLTGKDLESAVRNAYGLGALEK